MPSDRDLPRPTPHAEKPPVTAPAAGPTGKAATPKPTPAAPIPQAKQRSISRAAWFALVIGVVVLIFMLVFILQNNTSAQFTFLAWTFSAPLGVAMLFAAIGGALVTALVGTVRMVVLGRNVRNLEHERGLRG